MYEGPWAEGERSGIGVFKMASGDVEVTKYDKGQSIGDGIVWNADRSIAHKLVDGEKKNEISLGMAEKLARELFDMAVPPPHVTVKSVPTAEKPSILARLFGSNDGAGFMGEDGKWRFKDNGEFTAMKSRIFEKKGQPIRQEIGASTRANLMPRGQNVRERVS